MKFKCFGKITILLFSLLLFCLVSCCTLKKQKAITETVIHQKIDTIIKVHFDLIPVIVTGKRSDTLIAENTTSKAKTYFDTGLQKVVLKLESKTFDLPVQMNQVINTKTKNIDTIKESRNYIYCFFIGVICGLFLELFIEKFKRK